MAENKITANKVVRDYLTVHHDKEVWLPELRNVLDNAGLYKDDKGVASTVNNLRSTRFGAHIETIKAGQCWIYHSPGGSPADMIHAVANAATETLNAVLRQRIFYEVLDRKGYILIEDEDGILYVAKEIPL